MENVHAITLPDPLRQQESLRQVIESISSELELRPLLTRIIRHACELLDVENGTIGLVDGERGVIRTEAAYNMPPGEIGTELRPGDGVFGHVYTRGEPVIFGRYGDLEGAHYADLQHYTVLGVPISWRGQLIGVFGLGSPPPRRFTPHDADVLALFAKHAAIAIENARRYEREHQQTERLVRIARIGHMLTADRNIDALLERAAGAIHELLGYPNVAIALLDPNDPETLVLRVFGGFYRELMQREYRLTTRTGIMGAAVRERTMQLVNDVAADPRHIPTPGATGIVAELALPILLGSHVYGVLNVESGTRFTDEDGIGLQIVADQLAGAIENARLFADTQRALDETQLLYEISRRISTAMDSDEVIAAYLELVGARGRCVCRVAVSETDAQGRRTGLRVRGTGSRIGGITMGEEPLPYPLDGFEALLDAGQTVMIADMTVDTRAGTALRRWARQCGQTALALIPLMAHGQCVGLTLLSQPQARDWQPADLQPYQATAALLATALYSRSQYLLLRERGQQVAVLEERQRLARELHDSVTQLLFSMTLIAQSIAPAWARDTQEGERRVERLLELSQSALAEMRALLSNLRPQDMPGSPPSALAGGIAAVRQYGLPTALRLHAAGVAHEGIEISADTGAYTAGPLECEETLFRIAQEALNNVVKHARAQRVRIRLYSDGRQMVLSVQDDGVGFAPRAPESQTDAVETEPPSSADSAGKVGGLGLGIMRERAEEQGGHLQITAPPEGGTRVEVLLPLSS